MTKKTKQAEQAADYASVLETAWDNIPADPVLPDGSWRLSLVSATHMPASENRGEQVIFFLKAKDPLGDVDTEKLDALGKDFDVGAAKLNYTVWIEGPSDFKKVGAVLAKAGIADKVPNVASLKSVRGAGGVLVGQLKQRTYMDKRTDEEVTVSDVKQLAADE